MNVKMLFLEELFTNKNYKDTLATGALIHITNGFKEYHAWHDNGLLSFHCFYNENMLFDGPFNSWNREHRPLIEAMYKNGKVISMKKYQYPDTY